MQKTNPYYEDSTASAESVPSPLSSPATVSKQGEEIGTMRSGKPFMPNPGGGAKVMSHAEIQMMLGKTSSAEKGESYPNPGGGAKVMSHAEIQTLKAAKNNSSAEVRLLSL